MKNRIVVGGGDDAPVFYVECNMCGVEIDAVPRKVVSNTTWQDYDDIRTNRINVEFEAKHTCAGR